MNFAVVATLPSTHTERDVELVSKSTDENKGSKSRSSFLDLRSSDVALKRLATRGEDASSDRASYNAFLYLRRLVHTVPDYLPQPSFAVSTDGGIEIMWSSADLLLSIEVGDDPQPEIICYVDHGQMDILDESSITEIQIFKLVQKAAGIS